MSTYVEKKLPFELLWWLELITTTTRSAQSDTAAMAPAPSQFSRLLQQSRLSSFDPAIHQVYTAPKAFMARGEWGMKRPMPTTPSSSAAPELGMLRYVEVKQIDTKHGQADWAEREKESLFVKRWAEADTRLNIDGAESSYRFNNRVGSHGPRPTTSFLKATERYFPTDIPGPILLSEAEEQAEDPQAKRDRLYNNEWRQLMKHHAARGAADPNYKGIDYDGASTRSAVFHVDADKYSTSPKMMTNYNALSEKEFDKYVERVRAKASVWRRHYEKKDKKRQLSEAVAQHDRKYRLAVEQRKAATENGTPLPPLPEFDPTQVPEDNAVDMLEESRDADATSVAFQLLEEDAVRVATSPKNKRLPGDSQSTTLHPHAGLQYSQPDSVYINTLSEPVPGRVIHEVSSRSERDVRRFSRVSDGRSVLVGGRVGYLHAPLRSTAPPTIDWSRQDPKQGTGLFRVVDASRTTQLALGSGLHKDMLTPRNDLGYIRSHIELVKVDKEQGTVNNQYTPGSVEYIGQNARENAPVRRPLGFGRYLQSNDDGGLPAASASANGSPLRTRISTYPQQRRLGRNQDTPTQPPSSNTPSSSLSSTSQLLNTLENLTKPTR